MPVEHEVKLPFSDAATARHAIERAGGSPLTARRLVDDRLFDTPDGRLRLANSALRLRKDGDRGRITWKGPVMPGPVKAREELETSIGDVAVVEAIVHALGYREVFHGQKYREDYAVDSAVVTVDETPFGVFVEIEAPPEVIERVARRLGRTPSDYRLESYPALWRRWCEAQGLPPRDMTF